MLKFAMSHLHIGELAVVMAEQFLGHVDGSVLSSRAADSDSHIASIIHLELRQPVIQVAG